MNKSLSQKLGYSQFILFVFKAMFGSHKMRERKFGGKVEGKKKLKK